jgi:hypothetical protein
MLVWIAAPETGERKTSIEVRVEEPGEIALGAPAE